MQVSSLIQPDLVTCSDRDTLARVAQLMWERDLGCLPVVDDERRVIGMITDRDVAVAGFLQGAPLRSITVSSVMTKEVVTCRECDDLRGVMQSMRQRQIRRVPVVDDDGRLIGLISINDIARAAHAGKLSSVDVTSTLAAISRPRPALASAA